MSAHKDHNGVIRGEGFDGAPPQCGGARAMAWGPLKRAGCPTLRFVSARPTPSLPAFRAGAVEARAQARVRSVVGFVCLVVQTVMVIPA